MEWNLLPEEMIEEIISHLSGADRFSMKFVNRQYCSLISFTDEERIACLFQHIYDIIDETYKYDRYSNQFICWNRPKRRTKLVTNFGIIEFFLPNRFHGNSVIKGYFRTDNRKHHYYKNGILKPGPNYIITSFYGQLFTGYHYGVYNKYRGYPKNPRVPYNSGAITVRE